MADPDEGRMIYIKGLDWSAGWWDLKDFLKQAAAPEYVSVLTDSWGVSRGVGFARMATEADAQAVIAALNGENWQGKKMTVDLWSGPKPPQAEAKSKDGGGSGGGKGKGKGKGWSKGGNQSFMDGMWGMLSVMKALDKSSSWGKGGNSWGSSSGWKSDSASSSSNFMGW
eukprot:TRINITY_DN679_c0_g1_i1.p2 TRINITY_DN679_c0_g1~~TRINITY_DN679_c0_g1_i1.p2  ORF type:complete len:169 (+),score=40.07 TRINITY_DN679_c0_g1_i1:71-577(+)